MSKETKYHKKTAETVDLSKVYSVEEAVKKVLDLSKAKFNESIDVAVNLGVNVKQSDQTVRGATDMPSGMGRTVRIAVFAQGDKAEMAEKAGADRVGYDDLFDDIKAGKLEYDVIIATPDAMALVSKLGPVLGPRGLMPNFKVGTVTMNVAAAVKSAKAGQARYKTDRGGIIHSSIGKADFKPSALIENLKALLQALIKAKPSAAKGVYLKRLTLSSTMGPGIRVDLASLKL